MYFFDESELTEINKAEGVVLKLYGERKIMMSLVELSAGPLFQSMYMKTNKQD